VSPESETARLNRGARNGFALMIKNVIFDMDGVLVDSEDAITLAALEALHGFGVDARYEDFKQFTGMGEDMFVGGVARLHGHEFLTQMKDKAYEIYVSKADERVRVFPHAKRVLSSLASHGYGLALASAADAVKVKANIACIGVQEDIFAALVTGSDVERKKPDPEIFLAAAAKAGFDPCVCAVVEDAVSGVMAAKAAGMRCVAVTTSFSARQLEEAGADRVIDGIGRLEETLKELDACEH